jgi:hypothetical protein
VAKWGTRWRSWLRHSATIRNVAGSIPDCVIGIFHCHYLPGCTMVLWPIKPLAGTNTRNIFWGVKWLVREADNFNTFMFLLSWNLVASHSWNLLDLSRPVIGLIFFLLFMWLNEPHVMNARYWHIYTAYELQFPQKEGCDIRNYAEGISIWHRKESTRKAHMLTRIITAQGGPFVKFWSLSYITIRKTWFCVHVTVLFGEVKLSLSIFSSKSTSWTLHGI